MPNTEPPRTSNSPTNLVALERQLEAMLAAARHIRPHEPEDLVGEALVRLIRAERAGKLPAFPSDAVLLAYAHRTMRNIAAEEYRRTTSRASTLEEPSSAVATHDEPLITGRPESAESGLSPRARLSVVLRNRLGCSHELIARLLHHSSTGAGQCFHSRSLSELRGRTASRSLDARA
jgi:DNA-directed RNA polymerase specialized sigma24 family protein